MNKKFVRMAAVFTVFACVAAAALVVFSSRAHPDRTIALGRAAQSLIEGAVYPLRLARLSLLEPDASLLMPVYGVKVSQVTNTWGAVRGADRSHEGQDIFAPRGTPVFSATHGYVRRMGSGSALGGTTVFVTGAGGRRYYYAHLDRIADGLRVGQEVTTDTVLGFVGNTGNAAATPPHLHFGVYQARRAIDPLPLLVDR